MLLLLPVLPASPALAQQAASVPRDEGRRGARMPDAPPSEAPEPQAQPRGAGTSVASAADAEIWRAQAQQIGLAIAGALSGAALNGSPAVDLAQRLDMLPGVSVDRDRGDARFIRIRGLDPRWTAVRLDGDRLPASDPAARLVPLNLLPASLVERAEEGRTATPDADGDGIGGSVTLVPRLPQAAMRGEASVSGGYHAQRSDARGLGGQLMAGRRTDSGRVGLLGAFSALAAPLSAGGVDVRHGRTQVDASIQRCLHGATWLFVDLYNLTSAPLRLYQDTTDRLVREQDSRWWASVGLRMRF